MSIFPKRTIPGKGVTIHWNFNTSHLKDVHIFPFVRIGVRRPDGKETMLFEDHLLALPDYPSQTIPSSEEIIPQYLNKNIPLLILADYLSGQAKREALIEILSSIQSGRHFYFHYTIPHDAPLGKYTLISEVHGDGHVRYSKTAADDYFFVESISLKSVIDKMKKVVSVIENTSSEAVPVKVVECYHIDDKLKSNVRAFEISAQADTSVTCHSKKSFLLYNEEREVIPLIPGSNKFCLRNQQLLSVEKAEVDQRVIFIMEKGNNNAYKLEGTSKDIWLRADGITPIQELQNKTNKSVYDELVQNRLINEFTFNKGNT
jgi:hypothetical protein